MAAMGDVNGDGRGDLLVTSGVSVGPKPGQEQGKAYLLSGSGGGYLTELTSGDPYDENFGDVNAAVGDVNGDGFADYLLGSSYPPLVRVYSGKTNVVLHEHLFSGSLGPAAGGADFDGDGVPDYLITSSGG